MKQVYLLTYPTGKIYIGKDSFGSFIQWKNERALLNIDERKLFGGEVLPILDESNTGELKLC